MKTTNLSKKTISTMLFILVVSTQHAFAQTQNLEIENDGLSHNITFLLSVLLFIVGFTALIALKMRDDSKKEKQQPINHPAKHTHVVHRNHYGRRHQYNH